jgi:16S rRNA (guanine966-N2)-methyltransferase
MFSSWESSLGSLSGLRIADLYAGSGAVGLEALSRGAAHALLVEKDRKAARVIAANIESVALAGAELRIDDVERLVAAPAPSAYDLVFIDPPYDISQSVVDALVAALSGNHWLAQQARIVLERGVRDAEVVWPDGFEDLQTRKYGDTVLVTGIWYGRDT